MADDSGPTIEDYYLEDRTFPPPEEFKKQALVTNQSLYEEARADWQGFWAKQALALDWFDEWDTILEWDLPFSKWFIRGPLKYSYNIPDRHVAARLGGKRSHCWVG